MTKPTVHFIVEKRYGTGAWWPQDSSRSLAKMKRVEKHMREAGNDVQLVKVTIRREVVR